MSAPETPRLRPLYSPIEPFDTGWLPVSDGHEIYFEQSGRPDGEPLMFLHGGPGSGLSADTRRLFDPQRFRIIQFDQRCCGKSRFQPDDSGNCIANDTHKLISDIDALLARLGIDQVHLAGGSWGSTLALAFGVQFPERLRSLLLYGVFLCRHSELRALYFPGGVAQQLFPDAFDDFLAPLHEDERENPIWGYARLLVHPDDRTRQDALLRWTRFEKRLSMVEVDEERLAEELADPGYVASHSLIENLFFRNDCFFKQTDPDLLQLASARLQAVPTQIINGRFDVICPPLTAHQLHKVLPQSVLTIVPNAGHSFREPGITDTIICATERLPYRASH